jgi:predicted TIM-barrel fold metal-dependent hydrolase
MERRDVLKMAAGFALGQAVGTATAAQPEMPIVDCHIHLFDPTRAGGVAWPPKTDEVIYRPALPDRLEAIVRPLGVVAAIAVEASPLEPDNDWVLEQAEHNALMVGVVGNLVPGSPTFQKNLDRLRANPLLVGIRYGNLWDHDLYADLRKPGFVSDLRKLAACGLSLDSANPDSRLIEAVLEVSQRVPELRVVIDHLPNATLPSEAGELKEYWSHLESLGKNKNIFIKLSEVPVRVGDRVSTDAAFYRERLDGLWGVFEEDHVLFGSDWPNSDHICSYAETLGIVRRYVGSRGGTALEKYFWKNSIAAYGWKRRQTGQPGH